MILTSNIGPMIGRLKRLEAELPKAVKRATAVEYWKPRFETVALKTIRALWALERDLALRAMYERLTPVIVAGLMVEVDGEVTRFSLAISAGDGVAPPGMRTAMEQNLEGRTPVTGQVSRSFRLEPGEMQARQANLEAARAAVLEWVREEKHKDQRDAGLSDEEIAERLEWIMGLKAESSPADQSPAMQEAAARLAKRIQEFIGEESPERLAAIIPQVSTATAKEWLAAVLLAWRMMVSASLPARIKTEVEKTRRSIAGSML